MYIKRIPQTEENDCFQHGLCEFLANALHEEFNYPAIALVQIINERDDTTDDELLNMSYEEYSEFFDMTYDEDLEATVELYHVFSYMQRGNKTYYVDSTGITNNMNDILEHFGCKPPEGQSMEDYMDWYNFRLVYVKDPQELEQHFWSSKYDCPEANTERRQEAQQFVKEHKRDLNVNLQLRKMRERDER